MRPNSNAIPIGIGDALWVDANGGEDGADLHHADAQAIRGGLLEVLDFRSILAIHGVAAAFDPGLYAVDLRRPKQNVAQPLHPLQPHTASTASDGQWASEQHHAMASAIEAQRPTVSTATCGG